MNSFINKGSEWKRWEFHLHTPFTQKEDRYSGINADDKWEKFYSTINNYIGDGSNSLHSIVAIGITDYLSIEIYLKVVSDNKLSKNIKLVFPNVELRMGPIAKGSPVNIHCLFSPDIVNDLESQFFANLKFEYKTSLYNATKRDLIRLGKDFNGTTEISDEKAQQIGLEQFVISIETLSSIFKNNPQLREKTIIVVSNNSKDGASGVTAHSEYFTNSSASQLEATRRNIYQLSNMIFSSNEKDIKYFLGEGVDCINEVQKKCGSLKPCIHGCDAHCYEKIFEPDNKRYCWIKADPTFEGLKQVLYEPKDRVKIQEGQPEYRADYSYISKIELQDSSYWNQDLYLNKNLNVIIGGRSTGKSALLTSIARKFKSNLENFDKDEDKNFIKLLQDKIEIYWGNNEQNYEKEICFIEQNKMIEIAQNKNNKNKFLRKIIFEDEERKKVFDAYDVNISDNKIAIQNDITKLFIEFDKEKFLLDERQSLGIKNEIEFEVKKLENEKKELLLQSQIDENVLKKFDELQKQVIILNEKEQKLNNTKNEFTSLLSIYIFNYQNISWLSEIDRDYEDKLTNKINELYEKVNKDLKDFISLMLTQIENNIKQLTTKKNNIINSADYMKGKQCYENNVKILDIDSRLKEEKKKLVQIEQKEKQLIIEKNLISQLQQDIINNFFLFKKENDKLKEKIHFNNDAIEFLVTYSFNSEKFNNFLNSSFDMRKSNSVDNIVKIFIDEDIEKLIEFINNINNERILKSTVTEENFIKILFSTNWYEYLYDIIYENDSFSQMSPGKQAFIILKLLLNVSTKGCPILIDQPEDSLDNRSIYHELVKYIRETKSKRQIILVTHNPNIVVGADAELVIVANQHGSTNKNSNGYKFQYKSGSLESDSKEKDTDITLDKMNIREHICDILEGGKEAFERREKKYGFK